MTIAVLTTFVCVCVFDISCFIMDLARPAWGVPGQFAFIGFQLCVIAAGIFTLAKHGGAAILPVRPPDVRIAKKGPDPLLTLRAFACLLVLLGHYFAVVYPVGDLVATLDDHPWYGMLTSCPWAGVWVFYCLSGYLMGKGFFQGRYSLSAYGLRRFYTNRLLRIYPVYVTAIVIVGLLQTPAIFVLKEKLWCFFRALIFSGAGGEVFIPIGALNTVNCEFQFYLAAPFLAAGIMFVGKRRCCARRLWRFSLARPLRATSR
jgi:peptidoglycan/LPS O-acetylase OafA/YrhL